MAILTNAQVLSGEGNSPAARAYREMVQNVAVTFGTTPEEAHNHLCRGYELDTDDQYGGTYWADVVLQAMYHGDIDEDGNVT